MEASAVSIEPSTELLVEWLGEVPYGSALDLQASAVAPVLQASE